MYFVERVAFIRYMVNDLSLNSTWLRVSALHAVPNKEQKIKYPCYELLFCLKMYFFCFETACDPCIYSSNGAM